MRININLFKEKKVRLMPVLGREKPGHRQAMLLNNKELVYVYYIQSVSLVGFLIEDYGSKRFADFCRELRDGKTVQQALLFAYPTHIRSLEEFEDECPKSIDFLSEPSRRHFKEILEFLEVMDIPYQINHSLVGDADIGSETIFVIKGSLSVASEKLEELAYGFRFNRLAKKMGHRKGLLCNVLTISAKLKKKLKKVKAKPVKPQFYLVQFGPEAKLKSFLVLEELHKAGANIIHAIAKDKLGGQMITAEKSDAPYIILLGQKEALENSVVIRDTNTRHQETVPISNLATRAKELIK